MIQTGFRLPIKTISKWAILGVILTLTFAWLLLKSPILIPTIKIETLSFPADKSQLFYKKNSPYSEQNSESSKIDSSHTSFEFSLPLYDDDLRWDPLEKSGDFYVKAVHISVLGYGFDVTMDNITASFQMEKNPTKNLMHFTAPPGSTDPQINIHINSLRLEKLRLIIAFALATLITAVTISWIIWHRAILEYGESEKGWVPHLKTFLIKDEFSLKEFSKLLGIGVLFNILPMANFFLSADDEVGAYRTDPSLWISDGRWTAFLVEKLIFPMPVLPFVPNLFFYVCLAASYMFILRAHNLKFTWITALAYCVFVTHPIWWFIGEFYSNIPSTGFGVLCLSIAVYITSRIDLNKQFNKTHTIQMAGASFFLATAIGAYQSLIMFYLAAGVGTVIFAYKDILTKQSPALSPLFKRIGALTIVFFAGLTMYVAINKFAKYFYPVNYGYVDSFLRIDALLADPSLITQLTFYEMFKIYSGSARSFGVSFFSSAITLGLAFLFLISQKNFTSSIRMMALIGAMLISPFLLHFVTGAIYLPMRSMLAVCFISWISVVVILEKKGMLQILGIALTMTLIFQMVSINGQYSASTILATTHDRLTAESLYSRMAQIDPHFDRDSKTTIDVYGKLSFNSHYPSPDTSTMSSSFFDWDGGNVNRMIRYMQLIGLNNLYPLHPTLRVQLTPKFKDMPLWPAAGSVRLEDGVFLIKLSDKPDPTHAQYK